MSSRNTKRTVPQETDSAYFLKLVLYMALGAQWLRITNGAEWQIPVPIGFMLGLLFAAHEHFRIDRKVEYAILLLAMFIGFWLPLGIDILI